MSIKRPDIYEHNNPTNAFVDSNFVRGGFRSSVANLTALYCLSNNIDQLKEYSTVVFVCSEENYYELINSTQANNASGWRLFMNIGLPLSGASNGLSVCCRDVILGGDMLRNSQITTCNYGLCLVSDDSSEYASAKICLNTTYALSEAFVCASDSGSTGHWWCSSINSNSINLSHYNNASNGSNIFIYNTGITLFNKTSSVDKILRLGINGLIYGNNYCSSFINRSLIDKEYVDQKVSGQSNVINVCNIGVNYYTTTRSDDFIGISGATCIYLYDTPVLGQRVSVADICGNAELDPIKVDGNGKKINDGTISVINTNYGSITYIYNGCCWSAIAFIN